MTLIVCSLRRVPQLIALRSPSHLISLLAPDEMIPTPAHVAPDRHLKLGIHDIDAPQSGMVAANAATVERILEFGRGWDASAPLLVHCFAGISRSTATAFVLACDRDPGEGEMAIAMRMRAASPHAYPNRRIVALADDILGRNGRMLEAVEAMGGNNFVSEGEPFDIPIAAAKAAP
jgi:predicted protein tyrosine phosphatase